MASCRLPYPTSINARARTLPITFAATLDRQTLGIARHVNHRFTATTCSISSIEPKCRSDPTSFCAGRRNIHANTNGAGSCPAAPRRPSAATNSSTPAQSPAARRADTHPSTSAGPATTRNAGSRAAQPGHSRDASIRLGEASPSPKPNNRSTPATAPAPSQPGTRGRTRATALPGRYRIRSGTHPQRTFLARRHSHLYRSTTRSRRSRRNWCTPLARPGFVALPIRRGRMRWVQTTTHLRQRIEDGSTSPPS